MPPECAHTHKGLATVYSCLDHFS